MNWYAIIPSEILSRRDLTPNHKLLIGLISSLSHQKGHCFASNQYIGDCLGISSVMVRVLIKRLEELNLITREIRYKGNNEVEVRELKPTTAQVIQLHTPDNTVTPPPQQIIIPPPTDYHTSPNTLSHNNKDINIDNNGEFEIFWDLYNKKIDRVKCEKVFSKLSKSEKEIILSTVTDYVKINSDIRFRKNPLTYLNGKCFNDEIIDFSKKETITTRINNKPNNSFLIEAPENF